ncbi:MAG: alpha-ketoacid dehydrogenase subunit beta [Oscillospiraceae bacterium]|jgi:pyruvate dehydrogenase E1 component beta subunit|nr:alpha-ketoacid dehydrogenase subunit beta [Oscillospiraceae bacterium]
MKVTYAKAIGDALKEEMRRDSKILLFGEDVAEFGNIFGITRGMLEEFGPTRIRNTPIAETAMVGAAIGSAVTGLRPVLELMYSDFTLVAFSEIFHCVAKWRYMHGPDYKVPLVIRNASGSANGAGSEHSNCVESLFMHSPGLTIVTPSCAYDAKGLLKAAIRSDNPVLFCEPKLLYQVKQEIPDDVYESDYVIPLGVADVKREGTDVTLIAVGLMVPRALEAAEKLAAEGISVEVIDPRTIAPLDTETIYKSIRKTNRVAIVEESNKTAGIGAEYAARFQEELYDDLDGPVVRIAALDVPLNYNIKMEHYTIPDVEDICKAIRSMM